MEVGRECDERYGRCYRERRDSDHHDREDSMKTQDNSSPFLSVAQLKFVMPCPSINIPGIHKNEVLNMRQKTKTACLTLLVAIWIQIPFAGSLEASSLCVEGERSHFGIHVEPGGLFGAFAHDHDIVAKNIRGCAEIDWAQLEK